MGSDPLGRSIRPTIWSLKAEWSSNFRAASALCNPQARDTQTWTSRTGPITFALDQFHDAAIVVAGVHLDAHLRRNLGLGGFFANLAGFPDVVGQRFLAVDVLARREREQGGVGVRVLAGADHDGIECGRLVEEFAKVGELGRGGVLRSRPHRRPWRSRRRARPRSRWRRRSCWRGRGRPSRSWRC